MFLRSIIAPILLVASLAMAQDHTHSGRCKAHTITESLLIEQGLPSDIGQALPRVAMADASRGGSFTIPVVFHVVWNTTAENIPASAINAVMNQLNQDYSASNSNLSGVRAPFTGSIADVGFQFCLAQFDPQGNPTTGITRTQTSVTWFNPDTQTNDMKSPPQGKSAWDPTRYLNVWVCDISSGASGGSVTLGYAYLPTGGVVGTSIDGLVVDYQYGMALSSRTATHEIGHYFGLQHPWGNGGCGNDDGFTDTPNTDTPTFSCSNTNLQKCGVLTQYENFMDYANCSSMFTNQQASYMAGILTGIRSSLLSSNACAVVPTGPCIPTSANGTADGDFINGVQLGTINNQNSGGVGQPTYTNFSSTHSTTLVRGDTYTITIQGGTYSPNRYAAWIDYDQNNSFVLSEKLGEFTSSASGQTQAITFTVPAAATLGTTRLRVRGVFVANGEPSPADPCFNYAYGETEDYGITIAATPAGYCIPTSTNGTNDGDFINGVQLGSINNQNSGGVGEPTYTNFSSTHSTTLQRGGTYTIMIQGGTYSPNRYAAWIDYDQNSTFVLSEKLGEFTTSGSGQAQGFTFTVPAGAGLGTTRLRVRGVFVANGEPSSVDPCFAYAYGETEDYGITITAASSTYCIPTSTNGTSDGDYINGVNLGNIVNTNSGGVGQPTYSNLSATWSTGLVRGSSQTITIQGGTYSPDHYAAWIDYDQNNVFAANEKLGEFITNGSSQTQNITFTVPVNAALGTTRMRVRGVYHNQGEPSPTDPCFNYAWGETEDYAVVIQLSTGVAEETSTAMALYPNPARGSVMLQRGSPGPADVEIRDLQGRLVATHKISDDLVTLPLADHADGHYLVRVQQQGEARVLRLEIIGGDR